MKMKPETLLALARVCWPERSWQLVLAPPVVEYFEFDRRSWTAFDPLYSDAAALGLLDATGMWLEDKDTVTEVTRWKAGIGLEALCCRYDRTIPDRAARRRECIVRGALRLHGIEADDD